ncbi:hypothetical protein [Desulforhopalus sp. IMCC35007]|uniref:hypothetical protein n=1 Tax=Desulforhopalus sp. IMCC35007 TaxID=2569543 RepID=UPI0010ADDE94|nr:hypothetical protein [Desulforhopalus sp. IMCC35007]TKB07630.1 hypothetical protein FCL48_16510 [Desulforhopalus sp. IMCC35007]
MPNSTTFTPFPRRDFIPDPITMPKPERLRYLIETHVKLKKNYRDSYKRVVGIIETVEENREISLGTLTPAQKTTLLERLKESRNEIAKFHTQALLVFENMANELAPGTFPINDTPTTSGDFWSWVDRALEWLADLFREVGDVLEHLGWEDGADACDWLADRTDDGRQWIDENRPR